MKWADDEIRKFRQAMGDHPYTLDDVVVFIDPVVEFDAEKARRQAVRLEASRFLKQIKDADGHQLAAAYYDADGQLRYSFWDVTTQVDVLDRQIKRQQADIDAREKRLSKMKKRMFSLKHQISLPLKDVHQAATVRN